jgi:ankyrin repeat protein
MRAKYIYEALEDILRPKSEEEILSHLKKLSPNILLIKSSRTGFLPGVKLALERGANHIDALRWASNNGHKDVVELLLNNRANIHDEVAYAIELASFYGHKDVVKLLKKYM